METRTACFEILLKYFIILTFVETESGRWMRVQTVISLYKELPKQRITFVIQC